MAQGGPEDVAKIADFGIARRESSDPTTAPRNVTPGETVATADGVSSGDVENEAAPPVPSHDTLRSITHTGEILGTPVYMAPELLRGAKLANGASDVYALGVIAREVLTGNLPDGGRAGESARGSARRERGRDEGADGGVGRIGRTN